MMRDWHSIINQNVLINYENEAVRNDLPKIPYSMTPVGEGKFSA
jgi:hypothetical protein